MLKHVLAQQRVKINTKEFMKRAADRRGQMANQAGDHPDLTLEQAIGGEVDWENVAEMAVRQGTTHLTKRVLAAAAWGVLPTPMWLSKHGWEIEVVCPICGRTQDLRHTIVGCRKDEVQGMAVWQKAFAKADPTHEDAMEIRAQDLLKESLVQEFRKGSPVQEKRMERADHGTCRLHGGDTRRKTAWRCATGLAQVWAVL
jgi:hypothetical protein